MNSLSEEGPDINIKASARNRNGRKAELRNRNDTALFDAKNLRILAPRKRKFSRAMNYAGSDEKRDRMKRASSPMQVPLAARLERCQHEWFARKGATSDRIWPMSDSHFLFKMNNLSFNSIVRDSLTDSETRCG